MTCTRMLTAMLLVGLFGTTGFAQSIATDDFETAQVSSGKVASGSGFDSDWILLGKAKNDFTVTEKTLSYESGDIKVTGGSKALTYVASETSIAMIAARRLPAQSDTMYLSFLVELTNSKDTNDFFQVGFDGGGKSSSPALSAVLQGKFYPRCNTSAGGAPSMSAVKQDQTYLVVFKAHRFDGAGNYAQVTLFVNPESLDESANTSVVHKKNSGISQIQRLVFRKAFTEVGDTFTIDRIRVGKTFESVVK